MIITFLFAASQNDHLPPKGRFTLCRNVATKPQGSFFDWTKGSCVHVCRSITHKNIDRQAPRSFVIGPKVATIDQEAFLFDKMWQQ